MIDISQLLLDYSNFKPSRLNQVPKEDLEYLYITLNLSVKEVCDIIHCDRKYLFKKCKEYGIVKSKVKKNEVFQRNCFAKYGVKNTSCLEIIKNKISKTNKEYYEKNKESVRDKIKHTNIERYGVHSYSQTLEYKNKVKQTNLLKYNKEYYSQTEEWRIRVKGRDVNSKQAKLTCLQKYGCEHYSQTEEYKNRRQKTCIKKYGTINNSQTELWKQKNKETCRKKYGVDYYTQTSEYKERVIKTNNEKYGVDYYTQSEDFMKKSAETCLKRYGVSCASKNQEVIRKVHESKKAKKSYGSSKEENYIYNKLLEKFNIVERQYSSDLYPYACDFYIPSIDTYIEYQGYWTHGKEPFDENNPNHTKIVKKWIGCGQEINFKNSKKHQYDKAIFIWTISDVEKRRIAKQNAIKYIELWNIKDFNRWFSQL